MPHRTTDQLEAALTDIRLAPADSGTVDMVVRRPAEGEREVLDEGTLDPSEGLVGDNWLARGSRHSPDGTAEPERQLNVINSRLSRFVRSAEPYSAVAQCRSQPVWTSTARPSTS